MADWPYQVSCEHDGFEPEQIDPEDVPDGVEATRITGGFRLTWTCPVCDRQHEDEVDASDLVDA